MTLSRLEHEPARILSGGQRKLLELARILMADPQAILLDEPAAGVNPDLVGTHHRPRARAQREGQVDPADRAQYGHGGPACGRVVVMAAGRHLTEGAPADVARDQERHRRLSRRRRLMEPSSSPIALSTTALVAGYERDLPIVRSVDFAVKRGELVVVLGPYGAANRPSSKRSPGSAPIHSGAVSLAGADVTSVPTHQKVRHGLAFVPQTENIFATLSIHDNLLLAAQSCRKEKHSGASQTSMRCFQDLATKPARRAGALSGGQRQMLAVRARWSSSRPC